MEGNYRKFCLLTLCPGREDHDMVICPLAQVLQFQVLLLGGRMADLVASLYRLMKAWLATQLTVDGPPV